MQVRKVQLNLLSGVNKIFWSRTLLFSQYKLLKSGIGCSLILATTAWGGNLKAASSASFSRSGQKPQIEFNSHDQYTCSRQIKTRQGVGQDKIQVSYKISRNQEPDYIQVLHGKEKVLYSRTVEARPIDNDAYGLPVLFLTKIGKVAISAAVGKGAGQLASKFIGNGIVVGILVGGAREVVTLLISDSNQDRTAAEHHIGERDLNKGDWALGVDRSFQAIAGYERFVDLMGLKNSGALGVQLCQLDQLKAAEALGFSKVP
jgi:hypothetical protein